MKLKKAVTLFLFVVVFLFFNRLFAQRTGYSKEELIHRRDTLMSEVKEGLVVLFGEPSPIPGQHFRQDNDFYYFTGVEETNAVVLMIPKTKRCFLFLPQQTPREELFDGANLLKYPEKASQELGFTDIYPVTELDEFIARYAVNNGLILHARLQPRDTVDSARWENRIFVGRKNRLHYNDQITLDNYRIKKLKERYPALKFRDITPIIDSMRLIKSEEEIEILRRIGKISAEGVKQAMLASHPGAYEYEVEAAAMSVILKNGARNFAYPPIVGSGPNSCVMHYNKNDRQMKDGDILLMDFGGELDYMCMDISRTWPVNGKFTPEQKEVYEICLEVQKACIQAYKPGVTSEDVQNHVKEVMKKKGIDPRGLGGGIGHYVGMATHDVGPRVPLKEGMVFAIEPGLYYPEKELGIRIEDTVLITKDGCEVLTKDVPKDIHEIEELMEKRKIK
ncbi:MAG: aminopeptidase P N-terminal domain-containing protein [Acidobacteriota bacterium]